MDDNETPVEQPAEVETPVEHSTPPAINYEAVVAAAVRQGIEASRQSTPIQQTEEDPVKLWSFREDMPAAEQAKVFDQNIRRVINEATAPYKEAIRELHGRLLLTEKTKADDPVNAKIRNEAVELMRSGKINDIDVAMEFVKMRQAPAQKPKSKPVPPAVSAPVQTTALPTPPDKRKRGLLNMWDEYQNQKRRMNGG